MASRFSFSRTHTLAPRALATFSMLIAFIALSGASAEAEVTHKFLSSITEVPAQGPKGEAIAQPGSLQATVSTTIDGKDLYITETVGDNGSRIDLFDTATHTFLKQFDEPAPPLEHTDLGIGVGHATGSTQAYVGSIARIGGEGYSVVVPFDAEGHQLGQPWTGEDTPAGAFSGHEAPGGRELEGLLQDVAVDNDTTSLLGDWAAGDVFVGTSSLFSGRSPALNVIDVFKPEAGGAEKYLTQLTGTCESPGVCPGKVIPFKSPRKIAVDPRNGDLLVVDGEESVQEVVDMFRPGPGIDEYEFLGSVTGSPQGAFLRINAIAVDGGEGPFAEGEIYVVEGGAVYQFDSAGQFVGRFSALFTSSLAIDPATHDVFLAAPQEEEGQVEVFGPSLLLPDVTTGQASSLAPESATLNGTVNPDKDGAGETTCQFVWGTSESFGRVKSCTGPVTEGENPVPVLADLEGLEPDTTYYYRLQASNASGTNEGEASQTQHFTTPGPGVAEESASEISSTSATLAAKVDPHGASTTAYFQYGTTSTYGSDIPAAPGELVGAGEGDVEVTRHLQGLSPSTTYHYRVVIVSEVEVEPGVFAERSFGGHDQTFTTQSPGSSLVLPDGRAWELVSPADKHGSSIFPLPSPFKEAASGQVQSSASGDSIIYLASAPVGAAAPAYTITGQVLSERDSNDWSSQDLALAHRTAPGPTAGGDFRFFSEDLSLALAEPTGPFTSLVPEATPPDTERTIYLRHDDTCGTQPSTCYLPLVTGAPGYADVPPGTVIDTQPNNQHNNLLFAGATTDLNHVLFLTSATLTPEAGGGLYEWSADKPPAEELQLISGEIAGVNDDSIPFNGKNVISKDGSRVLFEASGGHLDQRETTHHQTVQLDEVQPGASGAGSPKAFLQAESSDGSVVYFTDSQKLTKDSGSSGIREASDLYECRMIETAGKDKCSLTDLTPDTSGESANVEGLALGASEDGAYIYIVATGVLSSQPDSEGEIAVAGAPNLYEIHNGEIELVAVLSSSQEPGRISPNGRYLAFMSDRSLTGYDNVDASSGKPDEEVFLFDSIADRLVCASCNPSGARPEGVELHGVDAAANIPDWGKWEPAAGAHELLRQQRYLSDSGRLFFNSSDALVPQDVNKNEDVYEYEPAGVGDCSASSSGYEVGSGGCVGLISSGTARGESTFMEASESGDDVFFLTTERLVPGDTDTAADVYDAHVCSAAAPCPSVSSSPPPCATADACRAAPAPQPGIFGSPASATFSGVGNVTPPAAAKPKARHKSKPKKCRKGFVKKKGKCVKAKKSAKKASHHRRGK